MRRLTDRDEVDGHGPGAASDDCSLRDALVELDELVVEGRDPVPVGHIEDE